MFDFETFYTELLNRTDYFDNLWESFPKGRLLRYKDRTLQLLNQNFDNSDSHGLECTLSVIFHDGADTDFTNILLKLLNETWHSLEEDIVDILEIIADPRSVDSLYEMAVNIPDYDEMRALAKKCMWALSAINNDEALAKLKLLQRSNDDIISENARFQLEQVIRRNL